jgi:hypothetical protein
VLLDLSSGTHGDVIWIAKSDGVMVYICLRRGRYDEGSQSNRPSAMRILLRETGSVSEENAKIYFQFFIVNYAKISRFKIKSFSEFVTALHVGLFGHHQVRCNSWELLYLPRYCELYTSAYSAIIRCVSIRGNC